ncbi:hypothetical protein ElyMa_000792700 [Elysia marginata]|uniref:Uncharacterized protein n=1 Tax=Elysia marginata TaxID=1093978 RepID=A0AAV4GUG2_9GAST|nr:hypothetical protein ElyMa_000792700 [Elysia marginata]
MFYNSRLQENVNWFSLLADPPTTLGMGSLARISCFLNNASSLLSMTKDGLAVILLKTLRRNTPSYSSLLIVSSLAIKFTTRYLPATLTTTKSPSMASSSIASISSADESLNSNSDSDDEEESFSTL